MSAPTPLQDKGQVLGLSLKRKLQSILKNVPKSINDETKFTNLSAIETAALHPTVDQNWKNCGINSLSSKFNSPKETSVCVDMADNLADSMTDVFSHQSSKESLKTDSDDVQNSCVEKSGHNKLKLKKKVALTEIDLTDGLQEQAYVDNNGCLVWSNGTPVKADNLAFEKSTNASAESKTCNNAWMNKFSKFLSSFNFSEMKAENKIEPTLGDTYANVEAWDLGSNKKKKKKKKKKHKKHKHRSRPTSESDGESSTESAQKKHTPTSSPARFTLDDFMHRQSAEELQALRRQHSEPQQSSQEELVSDPDTVEKTSEPSTHRKRTSAAASRERRCSGRQTDTSDDDFVPKRPMLDTVAKDKGIASSRPTRKHSRVAVQRLALLDADTDTSEDEQDTVSEASPVQSNEMKIHRSDSVELDLSEVNEPSQPKEGRTDKLSPVLTQDSTHTADPDWERKSKRRRSAIDFKKLAGLKRPLSPIEQLLGPESTQRLLDESASTSDCVLGPVHSALPACSPTVPSKSGEGSAPRRPGRPRKSDTLGVPRKTDLDTPNAPIHRGRGRPRKDNSAPRPINISPTPKLSVPISGVRRWEREQKHACVLTAQLQAAILNLLATVWPDVIEELCDAFRPSQRHVLQLLQDMARLLAGRRRRVGSAPTNLPVSTLVGALTGTLLLPEEPPVASPAVAHSASCVSEVPALPVDTEMNFVDVLETSADEPVEPEVLVASCLPCTLETLGCTDPMFQPVVDLCPCPCQCLPQLVKQCLALLRTALPHVPQLQAERISAKRLVKVLNLIIESNS